MAGLGPAIHVLATRKDVDARDKHGHDESNIAQLGIIITVDLGKNSVSDMCPTRDSGRIIADQHRALKGVA